MNEASLGLRKKFEELKNLAYRAVTNFSQCKSCGTCVKFCPLKIRIFNFERKAITITTNRFCGGCSVCYKRCPQNAISLIAFKTI